MVYGFVDAADSVRMNWPFRVPAGRGGHEAWRPLRAGPGVRRAPFAGRTRRHPDWRPRAPGMILTGGILRYADMETHWK